MRAVANLVEPLEAGESVDPGRASVRRRLERRKTGGGVTGLELVVHRPQQRHALPRGRVDENRELAAAVGMQGREIAMAAMRIGQRGEGGPGCRPVAPQPPRVEAVR
jgi:hypothetical protein